MTINQGIQYSILDYIAENENENLEQNSEEIAENVVFNFASLFNDNDAAQEMLDNGKSLAILGDSLDVLKSMKEKTVDLIFADAPYNIGKDFGNNSDKWETVKAYIDWCKAWIDESMRVLKDSGTMYFMTATQHMPYLDVYVSEKYNFICFNSEKNKL